MSSASTISSECAHRACAAHAALQTRDLTKLRRLALGAWGGPGSAAHRFALLRPQVREALVYALALRRIRDTAARIAQKTKRES
ncbi:MAG: hypothetical protein WAV78_05830 [Xanthobacteraceae bacterium]